MSAHCTQSKSKYAGQRRDRGKEAREIAGKERKRPKLAVVKAFML
jgi:hypothetical protein